jgi:hypothetical protein
VHGDFCNAVSTSTVVGAGHDCFPAERRYRVLDALIFGGNDNSGGATGFTQALDNVLDHWSAGDLSQGFAGKANGGVTRRHDQ